MKLVPPAMNLYFLPLAALSAAGTVVGVTKSNPRNVHPRFSECLLESVADIQTIFIVARPARKLKEQATRQNA